MKTTLCHLSKCFFAFLLFLPNRLQVNAILSAHPFHCPRRQHVTGWFHTKTGQPASVLFEPALESPATHSSGIGQFVLVRALHVSHLFMIRRNEQTHLCKRKTTKNTDNCAQNRQNRTKGDSAPPRCRTFAVELKNPLRACFRSG